MRFVWLSATFYSYGSQTLTAWKDKWGLIPRSPRTNLRIHPSRDDRPTPPTQSLSTAFKCPSTHPSNISGGLQESRNLLFFKTEKLWLLRTHLSHLVCLCLQGSDPVMQIWKFVENLHQIVKSSAPERTFALFQNHCFRPLKFFFVILYVVHFRSIIWR